MHLPSLFKANSQPMRLFSQIHKDFDRLYSEFSNIDPLMKSDMICNCEVSEDKSHYKFKFDMPGVKKNDVKVQLDDHILTISAERSEEKSDGKKNRYSEISYGLYQRSFTLPEAVDESKIDAKFENGVLTLNIPKVQSSNAKQISVH